MAPSVHFLSPVLNFIGVLVREGGFVALFLNHADRRVCCGGLCSLLEVGRKTYFIECEVTIGRIGDDRVVNVTGLKIAEIASLC